MAHYRQDQRPRSLAGALAWRALVHFLLSDWQRATDDAQEVLRLTQAADGDGALQRFRAEAYRVLGQKERLLGDAQQAIQQLRQALVLYQEQGDARGANLILLSLGAAYYDAGNFSSARACYQQALEYYQAHGERFLEAAVLNDLAVLHHIDGEYAQAFATFEQALEAARRGSNARIESLALVGIGDLFIDLEAPEAALQAYAQARQRVERSKDLFLEVYQQIAEAAALRLQGNFTQAGGLLGAIQHSLESGASNYTRGLWLLESGQLSLAQKHNPPAREQLAGAAQLFEGGSQRILAGRANLLLAGALFALGDLPGANEHLGKAFQGVQDLESQHMLVCAARQVKALLASPELSPANRQPAWRLCERVRAFEASLLPLRRSLRFQEMEIHFSPPVLSIQALGAARVLLDGKPVTGADWQTLTTRDLLYLILSQPHGWNKEVLGEILWPDSSPAQLKNRFKNAIYRLRRALSQDVILFDGERYSFNRDLDYSYDVERFEALLAQARSITDRQKLKQVQAELMRLYQGDYLPEVDGSWVTPQREHLHQAYLEAGLQLAQLHLDDSQPEQALEVCQRLIRVDACLEKAYHLGMQALAASGDRAGVARLYGKLQDSLETEMGMSPSAQTSALFRSLTR
ncbi:MAG: tetratricopeptide repeat protein [Chloroflexota bacterium]